MRKAALAFLAGVLLAQPTHADNGRMAMVEGAIQRYVLPGYQDFSWETRRLREAMQALCDAPSPEALDDARRSFAIAVRAWSHIELVRFGPVTEQNRLERILYWPDRKSIGLKQVQEILATRDASAANVGTLVQKSVAVQGLGALEFVLHGTGSETLSTNGDGYRCAYGRAIASNLEARAADIDDAWRKPGGMGDVWSSPGPDNQTYRGDDEALSDFIEIAIHGLELVRDVRINGFVGETASEDKPKQAIYWRSDLTVASIRRNVAAIGDLFAAADVAAQLPEDKRWLTDSIRFELGNADRALLPLDGEPIADVLADPEKRARLDYARLVTSSLSDLIARQLTAEFDLTAGFSSLDGD